MRKILVTGSTGQLGCELNELAPMYPYFDWVFADRNLLDLSSLETLPKSLNNIRPKIIINCAAYTSVDKAEVEIELADLINHRSVEVLAEWCNANECQFIHISTDYVFDGNSRTALSEDAAVGPINVYGQTKLAGEQACLRVYPNSIIIRTSWVFSKFGKNFVKTMIGLMQERESLNVVSDQIGSPTYCADLAQVILRIISDPNSKSGIYHFSNEGEVSWYEFAQAIQKIGGFECQIVGIPSADFPTLARRPSYSLLDKSKIKRTFQIDVPEYKDGLKKCIELLRLQ